MVVLDYHSFMSGLRRIFIDIPAQLWDGFWWLYQWYLAVMCAVCILITAAWLVLHWVGYPLP